MAAHLKIMKLDYQKKQDAMLRYYEKYISGPRVPQEEYVEKMTNACAFVYSCRSVSDIRYLESLTNKQIEIAAQDYKNEFRNTGLIAFD